MTAKRKRKKNELGSTYNPGKLFFVFLIFPQKWLFVLTLCNKPATRFYNQGICVFL